MKAIKNFLLITITVIVLANKSWLQNPRNAMPGNSNEPIRQNYSEEIGNSGNLNIQKPNNVRGKETSTVITKPRGGNHGRNNFNAPDLSFLNLPFFIFSKPFANSSNFSESTLSTTSEIKDCRTCEGSRWFLSGAVNASIPVGKFNVDHPQTTSYAKTGINVELDLHYYFIKRFNTGLTISLNKNSHHNPFYEPFIESRIPDAATNVRTSFNPWDSYNIMWNLGYSQPVWKNIALNFRGNIGLNITDYPKSRVEYNLNNNRMKNEYGSMGLGLVYGGGLAINYYFSPCFAAFINAYGYHSKIKFNGLTEKSYANDIQQREETISEPFTKEHTWIVVGGGIKVTLGKNN